MKVDGSQYIKTHDWKNGKSMGSQCYAGFPGLTYTAKQIKKFIPKSKLYVEPLGGMARTCDLKHDKIILNDMSDYVVKTLKENFGLWNNVIVTQEQYLDCVKRWDSFYTFFLFDPPYRTSAYILNPKTFIDRTDTQYFKEIRDLLPTLKGSWIVCSDSSRTVARIFKDTTWFTTKVESERTIYGKKSRILLISNRNFSHDMSIQDDMHVDDK